MKDVYINKAESIERCIKRAREVYNRERDNFDDDFDAQDTVVINILRACELTIDLANHYIKTVKLGIPKSSSNIFNPDYSLELW